MGTSGPPFPTATNARVGIATSRRLPLLQCHLRSAAGRPAEATARSTAEGWTVSLCLHWCRRRLLRFQQAGQRLALVRSTDQTVSSRAILLPRCPTTRHSTVRAPVSSLTRHALTPVIGAQYCADRNYLYAGVEYGSECRCGNGLSYTPTTTNLWECNMSCSGDRSQFCGAGWRIQVCAPRSDACYALTNCDHLVDLQVACPGSGLMDISWLRRRHSVDSRFHQQRLRDPCEQRGPA